MKPVHAPLLLALLATGCAASRPPANPAPAGHCSAAGAQSLVGQPATPDNVELARQRAGAQVARVLQPGQVVTMEYREGRLNIHVDRQGRIERITCG